VSEYAVPGRSSGRRFLAAGVDMNPARTSRPRPPHGLPRWLAKMKRDPASAPRPLPPAVMRIRTAKQAYGPAALHTGKPAAVSPNSPGE